MLLLMLLSIVLCTGNINCQLGRFHVDTHGSTLNNNQSIYVLEEFNSSTTPLPVLNDNTSQVLHKRKIFWEILQFSTSIIIFICGVLGNVLIALTIVQHKSMQNLQNYFVFSLAITDLVTLLFIVPLNLMHNYVAWPFGEFACKYLLPIGDVVPAVSIFMLVSISFDRYRAIVYALSRPPSLRIGIFLIVVIWILSYLGVGFPLTFTFTVGPGFWVEKMCYTSWNDLFFQKTYITLRTILIYIVPSIVIFVCYIRVNDVLKKNLLFLERSISGAGQLQRLQRQKHVMKMFFLIFLTFLLCYLPVNLINLFYIYWREFATWSLLKESTTIATIIGLANSACNPIILYYLSRAYRKRFEQYLPFLKWCCKGKKSFHVTENTLEDDGNVYDEEQRKIFGLFTGRRNTKESHVSLHMISATTSPHSDNVGVKEPRMDEAITRDDEDNVEKTLFVNNGYDRSTSFNENVS
ncbi:bombesin receptor subtype-3-like [Hydractinia symbiolongicarpus]|uniref:bombesin receptor subtype-3-like n=1 Tax=Hydractinia symbiolongicarpus TaxID=13093 RepID=UPI00254AA1D1|nr:bombesin receptor subtype-3-like [Hydractinia symbiolongicarpus]